MIMKDIKLKNIILAVLGIIVLGLGIGMNNKVGIGVDSLSATYSGLSIQTGLSLGTITALCNAVMVVISLILYKKNVGIATILFIFLSKWPVDFGQKMMIQSDNMLISIILCVICVFIIALGSELFILSDLGADSYTAMTMGIGKRLKHKVKYVYIRYACDGLFLIIAILLGGQIGVGTIISWAFIGVFMKYIQGVLVRLLHLETNSKI